MPEMFGEPTPGGRWAYFVPKENQQEPAWHMLVDDAQAAIDELAAA